jgi:cation transport regulator
VKDHLPAHAQEIYKEAFNSAWEQYAEKKDRRDGDSRETTSHKVAWSAVKKVTTRTQQVTGLKKKNSCSVH